MIVTYQINLFYVCTIHVCLIHNVYVCSTNTKFAQFDISICLYITIIGKLLFPLLAKLDK